MQLLHRQFLHWCGGVLVARDFRCLPILDPITSATTHFIATDDDGNSDSLAVAAVTVNDVTESASLTLSGIADSNQAEIPLSSTSATSSLERHSIGPSSYTGGDDAGLFTVNSSIGGGNGRSPFLKAPPILDPITSTTTHSLPPMTMAIDSLAVAVTVTDVTESASLTLSGIADSNQAEKFRLHPPLPA